MSEIHAEAGTVEQELHPAVSGMLRWFDDSHLPEHLKAVTAPIRALAHELARTLSGVQLREGLHALVRAKDSFVRAAVEKHENGR